MFFVVRSNEERLLREVRDNRCVRMGPFQNREEGRAIVRMERILSKCLLRQVWNFFLKFIDLFPDRRYFFCCSYDHDRVRDKIGFEPNIGRGRALQNA